MPDPVLYPRGVGPRLAEDLDDSPVVPIHGPRQSGKTTLAQYTCTDYLMVTEGGHLLVAEDGSLLAGLAQQPPAPPRQAPQAALG